MFLQGWGPAAASPLGQHGCPLGLRNPQTPSGVVGVWELLLVSPSLPGSSYDRPHTVKLGPFPPTHPKHKNQSKRNLRETIIRHVNQPSRNHATPGSPREESQGAPGSCREHQRAPGSARERKGAPGKRQGAPRKRPGSTRESAKERHCLPNGGHERPRFAKC